CARGGYYYGSTFYCSFDVW
nr:immunoglobulin heavy chain junction region [Mus musculus]MBK4184156.1 immunoglobulin heavy chain junction region [Mus musculus]MBK4184161.1 immunoglobulin heavy chain junction region [Mus musculus]